MYGHYLRGCVESVLRQEGVEVRVLILDDASPDDTPAVAAALVREDSRVEYRRHAVNQGHIATYNEGLLEWTSGDYCLLLSADDRLIPGALGRATRVMDTHPQVVLVYGRSVDVRDDKPVPPVLAPIAAEVTILTGRQFLELTCRTGQNQVSCPTAVVRTSVQKRVGGYSEELPHAGDMEMWLRLALQGQVCNLNMWQAYYRKHSGNMSTYYMEYAFRDIQQRFDAFEYVFRAHRDTIPDHVQLQSEYRSALSQMAFWGAQHAFEQYNMEAYQDYLAFAIYCDPKIRQSRSWLRMRWKQMMGPALFNFLSKFTRRLGIRGELSKTS
jgi:glycosyltransferase involved in cell wall biosynthesis